MALGNNIKTLVDGLHVTYAAIAEHCGTDTQAIQQLAARDSRKSQFAQSLSQAQARTTLRLLLVRISSDLVVDPRAPMSPFFSPTQSTCVDVINEHR